MLDAFDLEQMQMDLLAIRNDNPISIQLRRDGATLAAQTVRITRGRPGRVSAGVKSAESRADALIIGSVDLDIQIDDRFNTGGNLFSITFIRPDRREATIAEAQLVQ